MMNPSIETDCAVIEILPCGIIQTKYKDNYLVEIDDAKKIEKAFLELLGSKKDIYNLVIGLGGPKLFSSEALNYFAYEAEIVKRVKGSAIILQSLPNRMTARLLMRFHKPIYPTKIFRNHETAIAWLNDFRTMK